MGLSKEKVHAALEAARKYVDQTFYIAMCTNSARPEMLRNGTHTREEYSQACHELRHAEDVMIEIEAAFMGAFSREDGWPMGPDELAEALSEHAKDGEG